MCRETHLWYVLPNEVKSEQLLNQYLEILSPCEREHVFSMRSDELRKGALLARALVRTTIARCMTIHLLFLSSFVYLCYLFTSVGCTDEVSTYPP